VSLLDCFSLLNKILEKERKLGYWLFLSQSQNTQENSLREEEFILAHGFRGNGPSTALPLGPWEMRQSRSGGAKCSPDGRQETERKGP
jgi:hypothetical protein